MSKNLFIVGTGTDVGKTFISGLILKKLRGAGLSAAYFKAAMSGNERGADGALIPGDAVHVKNVSGIQQSVDEMCPYVYENAVSPHLAARTEGEPVDFDRVMNALERVRARYDFVLIEGSGGIVCPLRIDGTLRAFQVQTSGFHSKVINETRKLGQETDGVRDLWLEDFVRASGAPCLLVADAGLGTINSVSLTAFYMREKGLPLRGIIFNHFKDGNAMHEDNLRMCEHVTGLRVLTRTADDGDDIGMTEDELTELFA